MRTPVALTFAALTILHAVAPSRTTATGGEQEERASVSAVGAVLALDAAIQKRFERVDGRFGYTRLILPNGAHGFAPENDAEISSLRELEDANVYYEPPLWHKPARHTLGAVLLKAGKAARAEEVYREDLKRNPANGWSLYGLGQSLRAQGKGAEAGRIAARLRAAWAKADVTLNASRY